jgi:DNA mismatch endonuclease (patch repair protein)
MKHAGKMGDSNMENAKEPSSYARDPRSPMPLNEGVTRYMRSNRSKDTRPELLLRKALWKRGIRGYRLHWKKAPGKPDIAFPGRKLAVFMNGCFWHRCPHCQLGMPKHNAEFWQQKFARNVERDREKQMALESSGWKVLVIWECELKADVEKALQKVEALLGS